MKNFGSGKDPENEGGNGFNKDIYEASEAIKKMKGGQGSVKPVRPEKNEGKRIKKADGFGQQENLAKNKKKLMSGKQVPVSNIHIDDKTPDMYGGVDDPNKKLKARPMFVKANKKMKSGKARLGRSERNLVLIITLLLVVAGGLAAVIFLPRAEIVLRLRTAPLLVDETVFMGSETAGDGAGVSANTFLKEATVNGSYKVQNREMTGTKASGTAYIVNKTSETQKIKEQSRLITEDETLFYMLKHAIVPPNGSVAVPIEAAEAGEQANIKPQRLDFAALDESARSVVYAQVNEAINNGSGEEVAVVGESDLEKIKEEAAMQAKVRIENDIKQALEADWSLLGESWSGEVVSLETSAEVGDREPSIDYTATVKMKVLGYKEAELDQKIKRVVEETIDEDYMLFPGEVSFTKKIENINWEEPSVLMNVRVTHSTIPKISLTTLKDKLAGRPAEETKVYLEGLPGVKSSTVELWPFWVRSIPRIESRILIDIESNK